MKEDVLPEGWELKKLGSVVQYEKGKKPSNLNDEKNDIFTIPYIDIQGFEKGIIKSWTDGKNARLCQNSDLLMVWDGARAGLVGSGSAGALGSTLMKISFPKVNHTYGFYFLYSKFSDINSNTKGTGIPHVDPSVLWNFEFPIPPLPEQQYLSKKLTALLDEVAQTKQRLEAIPAQLKQFRQSVLADAVSGRLTEENADKWNTQPLKSLTTKIGSGSTPKGGNDVYKDSGIPFVRSLNIHTHFIKYEDLVFIDEVQAEKLKNVKIEENDVLLNITGASIGRVNIAPKEFVNGRVNQHVAIIRLKQEALLPTFLHLVLASPKFQKWIEGENYGTTRQALTKGMLEILEIHYPDIATQTQIVQKVETYFALADEIETQVKAALENVNLFTQSILAKAFSGELSAAWRKENSQLIQIRNNNE